MDICFDAIGEKYTTFLAGESVEEGMVCRVSANDTVDACAAGEGFCGVAAQVSGGCAAVVMGGYVELPYTGESAPALGYTALSADGSGGVMASAGGRSCLVVRVDETTKTLGLFL